MVDATTSSMDWLDKLTQLTVRPPERLDHFDVGEELGRGGFGAVYSAWDNSLERFVALKLLHFVHLSDRAQIDCFLTEARTMARLRHPNILPVWSGGVYAGVPYLVMPLISGHSLADEIRKRASESQAPLPEPEVLRIAVALAQAVAHAHANQVLHCDIKPSNVLIDQEQVLLIDFGMAKLLGQELSKASMNGGTLAYCAPEMLDGHCDAGSDLFSLGATLYELATGHKVRKGQDTPQLLQEIRSDTSARPGTRLDGVSFGLEAILMKLLEQEPSRRYASATQLLSDLQGLEYRTSSSVSDETPDCRRPAEKSVEKSIDKHGSLRRGLFSGLIAACFFASIYWMWLGGLRTPGKKLSSIPAPKERFLGFAAQRGVKQPFLDSKEPDVCPSFRSQADRQARRLFIETLDQRVVLSATLLASTLDSPQAIENPSEGFGGGSDLQASAFVAARSGKGARLVEGNRIVFPMKVGNEANLDAAQGEVEFWYRPTEDAAANDVTNVLFNVGSYYDVPRLTVSESDSLTFSITGPDWQQYSVSSEWGANVWHADVWVHVRAAWEMDAEQLRMQLFVDGASVDAAAFANPDWSESFSDYFGPSSPIVLGAADSGGLFTAAGLYDELVIRSQPHFESTIPDPPGIPPADPPADPPVAPPADPPWAPTEPVFPLRPLDRPAVGQWTQDPTFGTWLTRLSDESERGGFESHVYSQLQAFSADSRYILLTGSRGYRVLELDSMTPLTGFDSSSWNVPRWHPTSPRHIVHFDTNADTTVRIQQTDVVTGVTETILTLPEQYTHVRVNESFEELSDDGRYLAGMLTSAGGGSVLVGVDLQSRSLQAELPISQLYSSVCQADPAWGEVEPDWVGVDPEGRHLVIQWTRDGNSRCSGMETFDIQTGDFVGRVYDGHQHSDLGLSSDGPFMMTFELAGPNPYNGQPAIAIRDLPGDPLQASPPQFLKILDWGIGEHVSCQGLSGSCLITAGSMAANGWNAFEQELFFQNLDGTTDRLLHHRSTSSRYWAQPRASVSPNGRYLVFASDWAAPGAAQTDAGFGQPGLSDPYLVDLWRGEPQSLNLDVDTAWARWKPSPHGLWSPELQAWESEEAFEPELVQPPVLESANFASLDANSVDKHLELLAAARGSNAESHSIESDSQDSGPLNLRDALEDWFELAFDGRPVGR